jgi:hypothetical protein
MLSGADLGPMGSRSSPSDLGGPAVGKLSRLASEERDYAGWRATRVFSAPPVAFQAASISSI